MSTGVFVPRTPNAREIFLGEGAVWANYTSSAVLLGATQGGSKFNIDKKVINPKVDGIYGNVRGIQRVDIFIPHLIINFLKINYTLLGYGLPSTVVDQGDYHEFSFDLNFEASDVLTDVTFVGQKHTGQLVKISVFNALNVGDIEMDFKEKGEVTTELDYRGCYAAATPTVPPFEYFEYQSA